MHLEGIDRFLSMRIAVNDLHLSFRFGAGGGDDGSVQDESKAAL